MSYDGKLNIFCGSEEIIDDSMKKLFLEYGDMLCYTGMLLMKFWLIKGVGLWVQIDERLVGKFLWDW